MIKYNWKITTIRGRLVLNAVYEAGFYFWGILVEILLLEYLL